MGHSWLSSTVHAIAAPECPRSGRNRRRSRNKGEGMVWQRARLALLAGCIVAAAAVPARAGDCAAPAPCTRTVCCTEWVAEKFQSTRTVYKHECKRENYTAYRCECVPEIR